MKEKIIFRIFLVFHHFFNKKISFSEKITFHFSRLRSQILLNNCRFSHFSQVIQHVFNLGKIWNGAKVVSFHLRKRLIFFYLKCGFWQYRDFTKYRCFNAPKWPQMPHKWVNITPYGSGHTLGTLNHGLGSLFCCFITLFGARGSQDPPGAPWCPLAPPWTPWCPHDPWYVILGHSQSSWVIMSHIWPIWSE